MPVVICAFCEYMGEGNSLEEEYLDAQRHELNEHRAELVDTTSEAEVRALEGE